MSRAQRKTWQDFQASQQGTGPFPITLDNFHDVDDNSNPDLLDRAVASNYMPDTGISYAGVVKIDDSYAKQVAQSPAEYEVLLWRIKAYFREAFDTRDVAARIDFSQEGLPVLMLPEGDVDLPVKPDVDESQDSEEVTPN